MSIPKLKARIQNKYKLLHEWNDIDKGTFIPLKGEVCYGIDNGLLYQKIGNGQTDFVDLPWLLNQSDNEENDETSPSYIKNRLAYPEYTKVPEDEQSLYEDVLEGEVITKEEILTEFANEDVQEYINTHFEKTNTLFFGEGDWSGPSELLQNPYNKLWINIYSANGEKIAYDFNSKDKQISETTALGYQIACFGNTHWANFFINVFSETMDSPIMYYPLDNISTDKYCILLFGPMQEDDWDVYTVIALLDCETYPYRETQDTDGSLIYQYPYDIRLTDIGKMHTIDQKYLGDIQSDQLMVDAKQLSHIKNRFGERSFITLNQSNVLEGYGFYDGKIQLSNYSLGGMWNVKSETVYSSWTPGIEQVVSTCDVYVGGKLYQDCPLHRTSVGIDLDAGSNGTYFLGNPKYIGSYFQYIASYLDPEDGISIQSPGYEDNGLPFFIECDFSSSTPIDTGGLVHIEGYGNLDYAYIKIYPKNLIMELNPLPIILQEKSTIIGTYDVDNNSVLMNSSYEASGSNSLAIGYGTKAQGDESFAGGEYTQASGDQSVALGIDTVVSSDASFGFGTTPDSMSIYSYTIKDNWTITVSDDCRKYKYIRFYYQDTSSSNFYSDWYKINSVSTNGSQYNISFSNSLGSMCPNYQTIQTIYLKNPTTISAEDSVAFGSGHTITGSEAMVLGKNNTVGTPSSMVFGHDNISTGYGDSNIILGQNNTANGSYQTILGHNNIGQSSNQTILGYYNIPTSDLLIVGNGTSSAQSNAMTLSDKGEATFAGSVETTSVILTSPNGTKFKITIDDNGNPISTKI